MTPEISDLITKFIKAYAKETYKAENYTDTYSREFLLKGVKVFEDWLMFQHCAEDRKAMKQSWDGEDASENKLIDKQAEQEIEWKDAQIKDIPWNRLMANKDTFTEKQANLIINNPDLFL